MTPKRLRLSRAESSRVDREGFRASVGPITAKILMGPAGSGARFVVVAGKTASVSSVDRHTIRRRVSAAMVEALTRVGFCGDVAVRVRADVSRVPYRELVENCVSLLVRG